MKLVKIRSVLVVFLVVVFLITGLVIMSMVKYANKEPGFNVRLENQTNASVNDLMLYYDNIKTPVVVPAIKSGEKLDVYISPTESFSENTLNLSFKNKVGSIQKFENLMYFEEGIYPTKIKIVIVDDIKNSNDYNIKTETKSFYEFY